MKKILLATACTIVSYFTLGQTQQNTLNTTGNVGVGTTNPATPLEVVGKSNLKGSVAIDSSVTIGDSMVVERDAKIKQDLRVDGKGIFEKKLKTKKDLIVKEDAHIDGDIIMEGYADSIQDYGIMFLDEDGRTFPKDRTSFARLILDIANAGKECLQDLNGNVIPVSPTWHSINPDIVSTGIWNCERNAKVGINTDDPQGYLHVIGFGATNTDRMLVIENPDYDNGNGNHVLFQVGGDGLVFAREIKVNLDNWPDYVFKEDYVLMPLSEVEKYIEENGHLPNVKSAEEIEKEGLNLGETNKILMEKMEEMTLYMIELEKKVKALEEKLNEGEK